jgi:hypothetical protein
MTETAMRRRYVAVFLATLFLSWGAVLTFAGPQPDAHFSIADSKR